MKPDRSDRAHNETACNLKGNGFWLDIVKPRIERHGGKVEVGAR
jgi:hypothetical protein